MKKRYRLLILIIILFLITIAVVIKKNSVHIGNQYTLDELEENQTVMAIWKSSEDIIVVNKHGQWKFLNAKEKMGDYWYSNDKENLELLDYLLQDDSISYQKDTVKVNSKILKKAINVKNFKLEKGKTLVSIRAPKECNYYIVTGTGNKRRTKLIGTGAEVKRTKWDLRIMMMRRELDKLDKERERLEKKKKRIQVQYNGV